MQYMEFIKIPVPGYRPKVQHIMVKQYGLKKAIRVGTRNNGDIK